MSNHIPIHIVQQAILLELFEIRVSFPHLLVVTIPNHHLNPLLNEKPNKKRLIILNKKSNINFLVNGKN
jgi:hypothetical protein